MKLILSALAAVAILTACDVNVPPAEKNTTIVNPPAQKTEEKNTTVIAPSAEKKTETNTTTVTPGGTTQKTTTETK